MMMMMVRKKVLHVMMRVLMRKIVLLMQIMLLLLLKLMASELLLHICQVMLLLLMLQLVLFVDEALRVEILVGQDGGGGGGGAHVAVRFGFGELAASLCGSGRHVRVEERRARVVRSVIAIVVLVVRTTLHSVIPFLVKKETKN